MFSCSTLQVPFVDLPLASSFCIATIIGCSMSLVQYFRIIFTGGVGKNGSSVAVSLHSRI